MAKKSAFQKEISIGPVTFEQKVTFARHMSVMLKSGLTVLEALVISQDAAKGKMKKTLLDIIISVESGNSLSDSFAAHHKVFTKMFINVVKIGEKSGTLQENFKNLAEQLEKEKKIYSKIKSASVYPSIVLLATGTLGYAMAFYVLPQIIPLFKGLNVELPWTTRIVISFSELMRDHGEVLFVGLVFGITFLVWFLRRKFLQPITHWILLHVPVISMLSRSHNLARFCLTFGTLLRSGTNVDEALDITAKTTSNYYFRHAIESVARQVKSGEKVSEGLLDYGHLFPKILVSMVRVGEESGSIDETMIYLAENYESDVDNATKALTTTFEPLLLIIIGSLVGILALAIISPIYQVTGNLR